MIEKHVYNTGKVKIGINYQKPYRVDMSRDMERLQTGLISRVERKAKSGIQLIIILAMAAMIGYAMSRMV